MALWLHLIPQLHRPGAAPRHHQFRSVHPDMFAGEYSFYFLSSSLQSTIQIDAASQTNIQLK
jgi:hypothetical protein